MKFRKLGKTGLNVSEIGLGTAQLGGSSFIGGEYIGSPKIEKEEAISILNYAYDSGINFYDSSDKYGDGEAERLLGEVFYNKRDKVILATKCGITVQGTRCFKKKYVKKCLQQSLKNLRSEYIDVFQLTKPGLDLIQSGVIYEIFDELEKEGKIRFSGVSTGSDEEAIRLIKDNKVDTLQIFYNLLYIRPNELFIQNAFEAEVGLIVRSPLSSGVLTGKYNHITQFPREDDRSRFLYGETLISRVNMVNSIISYFNLTRDYNVTHFSLNYLLSNERISTIIPGVSKKQQLIDILKVCTMERMSHNLVSEVEDFIRQGANKI